MCQLEFATLECHEKAGPPPEWARIHSLVAFSHRLVNRVSQGTLLLSGNCLYCYGLKLFPPTAPFFFEGGGGTERQQQRR